MQPNAGHCRFTQSVVYVTHSIAFQGYWWRLLVLKSGYPPVRFGETPQKPSSFGADLDAGHNTTILASFLN